MKQFFVLALIFTAQMALADGVGNNIIVCKDTLKDNNAVNVFKVLKVDPYEHLRLLVEVTTKYSEDSYSYDFGWINFSEATTIEAGKLIQFTHNTRFYPEPPSVQIDNDSVAFADPYGGVLIVNLKTKKGTWSGAIKRKKNAEDMKNPMYDKSEPYVLDKYNESTVPVECVFGHDPIMFSSWLGKDSH